MTRLCHVSISMVQPAGEAAALFAMLTPNAPTSSLRPDRGKKILRQREPKAGCNKLTKLEYIIIYYSILQYSIIYYGIL